MARCVVISAVVVSVCLPGCSSGPALTPPRTLVAPYSGPATEVTFAVVPLRNESGTSVVDALSVSDSLVARLAEVRGIDCVPLNRTLEVMQSVGMDSVGSPAEAKELAGALGVDALVLGSITAYDPYDPPVLGLSLALYAPSGSLSGGDAEMLNTRRLTYQPTDYDYFASLGVMADRPASSVAEHLDARNHGVLMDLRAYADGRSDRESALGWRLYTRSMDRYTEFAAWHAVSGLMDREWIRVGGERLASGN